MHYVAKYILLLVFSLQVYQYCLCMYNYYSRVVHGQYRKTHTHICTQQHMYQHMKIRKEHAVEM